uniref:NB-ARC domain-containing protein n=1 Tax=Hordeum vulgare subsp. vulgare TaxID=112509 RepID=A0A8I6WT82_HORVV
MGPVDAIHQMEPLSEEDSETLFHEGAKRPAANELLKMCGGMPLAIIVAAGRKPAGLAESEIGERCILSTSDQYSTSDGMRMILQMSYDELPAPLKSCLLYLCLFPEYYTIKKERLIRLWIAEGFILGRCEESLWRTGDSYFNELIGRGLIHPVFGYEDDRAVACTVHGVILEFIKSLSRKYKFATTGADLRSGVCPWFPIRHFSVDYCSMQDEANTLDLRTLHLSSMRTLQVFGPVRWKTPDSKFMKRKAVPGDTGGIPLLLIPLLSTFKFLRVLDLEDNDNLTSHHLKGIGGLVLLRYLGLRGSAIHELPDEIGKLEHLETLDVRHTNLRNLPASIVGLERLVCLLIEDAVEMLSDMLIMQGLQEVSTIGVDNIKSLHEVVELLARSERLSILGMSFDRLSPSLDSARAFTDLLRVVGHSKLRSLSLHCLHGDWIGLPDSRLYQLRRFEVSIPGPVLESTVSVIPCCITHLNIEVTQLGEEGLSVMASMPQLVLLKLASSGPAAGTMVMDTSLRKQRRRAIIRSGAFLCLKVFWFTCKAGGNEVQFDPGAMPQLHGLRLHFNTLETLYLYGDFEFGIEHLSSLNRIHATLACEDTNAPEVVYAEAAIKQQVCLISSANTPTVEFSREKPRMFEEKKKTAAMITQKNSFSRWLREKIRGGT